MIERSPAGTPEHPPFFLRWLLGRLLKRAVESFPQLLLVDQANQSRLLKNCLRRAMDPPVEANGEKNIEDRTRSPRGTALAYASHSPSLAT